MSWPQDFAEVQAIIRREFKVQVASVINDASFTICEEHPCVRTECTLTTVETKSFEPTRISFNLRFDTNEMWIGFLHVALPLRSVGLGRQLVRAAEESGRTLGMNAVCVFPLRSAQSYWLQLGYRPHQYTAKVLSRAFNL